MADATTQMPIDETPQDPGTLEQASELMPWAISLVLHLGLLLALMFCVVVTRQIHVAPPGESYAGMIDPNTDMGERDKLENRTDRREEAGGRTSQMRALQAEAPTIISTHTVAGAVDIGIPDPRGNSDGPDFDKMISNGEGDKDGNGKDRGIFGRPESRARSIVFLVDCSGSMVMNFDYVREEMVRYIQELRDDQKFHVVFFSDARPAEFRFRNDRPRMMFALPPVRKEAVAFIRERIAGNQAGGGRTLPGPAVERAFQVPGGPPELIYLLTDGYFDPDVVGRIRKLNAGKKVRVNTISYISNEGEKLLKKIAEESGGQYRFVRQEDLGQ